MAIQRFDNNNQFDEIIHIIEQSRENALRKVNEELIMMYWRVGEYISRESEEASYGDSYIQSLADFFSQNYPQIKGFNRRGLYRMKQFYETYKDDEKVSTLLTQLSWSNHLKLLSACKSNDERLFYMQLCIKEGYSARELARQVDSGYYERYMLSKSNLSPAISQAHSDTGNIFLDNYVLDFLDLPEKVSEKDLQKSILNNLKALSLKSAKILPLSARSIEYKSATTIIISICCFIIEVCPAW